MISILVTFLAILVTYFGIDNKNVNERIKDPQIAKKIKLFLLLIFIFFLISSIVSVVTDSFQAKKTTKIISDDSAIIHNNSRTIDSLHKISMTLQKSLDSSNKSIVNVDSTLRVVYHLAVKIDSTGRITIIKNVPFSDTGQFTVNCNGAGGVVTEGDSSVVLLAPCRLKLYAWDVESFPEGVDSFEVLYRNKSIIGRGNRPKVINSITSGTVKISGWSHTQLNKDDKLRVFIGKGPLSSRSATVHIFYVKN